MKKLSFRLGQEFHYLTIASSTPSVIDGKTFWWCRCKCGTERWYCGVDLNNGHTRSCGCLLAEKNRERLLKHGATETQGYNVLMDLRRRCSNPNHPAWKNYGGRKIKVCKRWASSNPNGAVNFFSDMGQPPTKWHEIERRDNNGDYTPENCYWATREQQARNKRTNHELTIDGVTKCIAAWSEESGVPAKTIQARIARFQWPPKEAVFTPITRTGPRSTDMLTFEGETHALPEWARIKHLPYTMLYQRIHVRGWTVERALMTPA